MNEVKIKEEYIKFLNAIKYTKSNPKDFRNFKLGFIAGCKYSEKEVQAQKRKQVEVLKERIDLANLKLNYQQQDFVKKIIDEIFKDVVK